MQLQRTFERELAVLDLPRAPGKNANYALVGDDDIAPLPATVQRYLRFMRVLGRPRDWSFVLRFYGHFRRSRDERWMKCEAWQYNTSVTTARVFYIQLRFFGLVPVLGRDTYLDGRGRMLIRLLDRLTVGDGTGEAYDIGELVTYLNDAVFIAPSMLLAANVRWSAVDENAFDVELSDRGRSVSARVSVDAQGAPIDFATRDRYMADPKDANKVSRCLWTTPMQGFHAVGDRCLPTRGQAIWHPPEGELAYADFTLDSSALRYNLTAAVLSTSMQR